jgi:O-acetyl-ADP-ribose deacetylase (regulator of RNase III)
MSKSRIEICEGSLFKSDGHLAHGVNCAGAMGKGIAVEFKRRFPEMYEKYRARCGEGLIIPGSCWSWYHEGGDVVFAKSGRLEEVPGRYIFNLAIKAHWRLPASYVAIKGSVTNLIKEMKEHDIDTVSMPWIGCGLGGLQKNVVRRILEKALEGESLLFRVYEL